MAGNSTKALELTGKRFGRLMVIKKSERKGKGTYWWCSCDCGNVIEVYGYHLNSGHTKSCGCARKESLRKRNKETVKHGMSRSRLYGIYYSMRNRCAHPKTNGYENYGGRGIRVCEEWLDSFEAFMSWALENGYDDSLTLDRIDSDGNYEPSNCRWTTAKEQMKNRRNTLLFTYNGKTLSLKEWAEEVSISYSALYQRLSKGLTFEEAISKPYKFKLRGE